MDTFNSQSTLKVGDKEFDYYRLDAVEGLSELPYSLKILAENLLRTEDGQNVTADHIRALASWDPEAEPNTEIQFTPARVLLQDFTGVPSVVDLAAMREAYAELGGDPESINPQVPSDLVIDHSVIIDVFGTPQAFDRNIVREYERNGERYQFLRWGQEAFNDFKVVPPDTGICHQVNIEYLTRGVFTREIDGKVEAYPDTCVGTDSHTTMVNGLGVLGWGVGGIEAEAAMLGQPISMLIPKVVGFRLTGSIPTGATATDVVLTITQMLREHGVVGKFVEFIGDGVSQVPLANRATIGNMSPEFGSTAAIFPIDQVTVDYLYQTGRSKEQTDLVEAYAKAQGLWHDASKEAKYSEYLELDLSTVVPSIAGPKRPQDRVELSEAKDAFRYTLKDFVTDEKKVFPTELDDALKGTFPASDPVDPGTPDIDGSKPVMHPGESEDRPNRRVPVTLEDGTEVELDHGDVVIASITSCTNTSNPEVMMAAGLLARKARALGLKPKPWVKTSVAPGSQVVSNYYERAGLWPDLEDLGFYLVGYGCTTCIGNSGPLEDAISEAVNEHDLTVVSVLSGNRNFEGRIQPDVKMNYLASPPLVIAYSIAGTMDFDFESEPLGQDQDGNDVFLKDIWPTPEEVQESIAKYIDRDMFLEDYADVYTGDEHWRGLEVLDDPTFDWVPDSTYIRRPPFFDGMGLEPKPVKDIHGARVLLLLGDSVTTDHISPAGAFRGDSPAGQYLLDHGVEVRDFNSYGSRRGNHEVMVRGTFANIRIRNEMLDDVEGGFTQDFTQEGKNVTPVYDAAMNYLKEEIPLVVIAGKEYGSGSSRDWAAKGVALLGVRAVITESFERIHRSNLLGMGVLPLEFAEGQDRNTLGLDGTETFDIVGLDAFNEGEIPKTVHVTATKPDGTSTEFDAVVRVDTPAEKEYFRNGGILQYVLRQLKAKEEAAV